MTSDESARVPDSARETAAGPPPEGGGVLGDLRGCVIGRQLAAKFG